VSPRSYLDHASTSPLRPEAVAAITAWAESGPFADPGRQYVEGRLVRDAVEDARSTVARFLGVRPRELVFTSGGTEAANMASAGARRAFGDGVQLFSAVEHSAVRLAAERDGPAAVIGVDRTARLDLDALERALHAHRDAPPILLHCQFANHEVATLQPLAEAISLAHGRGVAVHVDGCCAIGQMELDLASLDADLVSVSAHKLGGPPGVGALAIRRGTRIAPLLLGGDQERGRRAGTENVPGVLGFAAAAAALSHAGTLADAAARARRQTDALRSAALKVEGVVGYGDDDRRVPHIVCLGIGDVEAEAVVLGLDQAGIAVHSGSACASESLEPSPVLEAMGVDAQRSIRLSVGWSTHDDEINAFATSFPRVIAGLRSLAGSGSGSARRDR
jgi:cysteine desulfurase